MQKKLATGTVHEAHRPLKKTKTQPLGATLLKFKSTQEKTHLLAKFPGVPLNMPFLLPNIFNKGKILEMF